MTNVGSLVLILVCVGIGYILEPIFFSDSKQSPLVPKTEEVAGDSGDGAEDAIPEPPEREDEADTGVEDIQIDLSKVTEADFPEKVTLKVKYTLADEASGVTMQLKEGAKVQPVRLDGEVLVFRLGGLPIEGDTHVNNTDFKKLVVPIMLKRLQDAQQGLETSEDEVVVDDTPDSTPEAEEEADPEVMPDPAEETEPEPVEEQDDDGFDMAIEEDDGFDTPEEDEQAGGGELDAEAVVGLMKASVAAGKVTEFEAKDVTSWRSGEVMEFDETSYQTGVVTFKTETILGVQEHDAIALIEGGAVVKWVWAKTKLEMK